MQTIRNTGLVIFGVLVAAAMVSWFLYFADAKPSDTIDIKRFPTTIAGWSSEELPISAEDLAILETKNAFVRRYTNPIDKASVYLYIVYSQGNRKVAHPPEICYTGSGLTVIESVHDPIKVQYNNLTIETNRLRLQKGSFEQIAYYWFKVGKRFTANYWQQQFLLALDTLTGKKASSALVRISADVAGKDDATAIRNIKTFTDLIAQDLFSYLP